MSEESPVTIIIPTRNRPQLLCRAIDSVVAQTYSNWEIIIVNDAGNPVEPFLEQYLASLGKRLRIITHPFQLGPGAARNTALRMAKGKYVFYLDDDDLYLPGHVKILVNMLESNELDLVFSRGIQVLEDQELNEIRRNDYFAKQKITEDFLHVTNAIQLCGIAHRLDVVKEVGFFDEDLTSFEDWDFILRFIKKKKCGEFPDVTFEVYRREDTESVTIRNKQDHVKNYKIIYDRYPVESSVLQEGREGVLSTLESAIGAEEPVVSNDVEIVDTVQDKQAFLDEFFSGNDLTRISEYYNLDLQDENYLAELHRLSEDVLENNMEEPAVTAYVRFLSDNPEYADGHVQLGYLLKRIGETDTALHAFDNALSLSHDRFDASFFKAGILAEKGEVQSAIEALQAVMANGRVNPIFLHEIVRLHSSLVPVDTAIRYGEMHLAEAETVSARTLNHIGNLYYRANDYNKALEYYQQSCESDNNYSDAHVNRDLAKIILGNEQMPLFLVLPRGENYGWGVCSDYLRQELPAKTRIFSLEYEDWVENGNKYIPGTVFTSIGA
jgi:glycosyltransferase involved in cell wall biosynthesis